MGGTTKLDSYLNNIDLLEIESQDIPCGQGHFRAANNSCKKCGFNHSSIDSDSSKCLICPEGLTLETSSMIC